MLSLSPSQRGCEYLELAYLSFLEQFRKVYIGDTIRKCATVYHILTSQLGVSDEAAVLNIIMQKMSVVFTSPAPTPYCSHTLLLPHLTTPTPHYPTPHYPTPYCSHTLLLPHLTTPTPYYSHTLLPPHLTTLSALLCPSH